MRKLLIALLIVCFLYPVATFAGIHGILKGRVTDNEGKPVIGASVFVEGTTRGTYVKDKDGGFTIVNIVAGKYTVLVRAVGFAEYRASVSISADQVTNIDIKLASKDVQLKGVVVDAKREMNDKGAVGSIKSVTTDEITNVPVNNVQSVVGLEAGVLNAGGGYYIRGSRTTETQIRVDNLDVGNQFTGGFGSGGITYFPMVSAFATEEVQVLTGGFSAEYGDAMGGVVNTVVKTGRTDRYEGFLRWNGEFEPLYGSQSQGVKVVKEGDRYSVIESGPGKKAVGSGDNTVEFGTGGPIPYLDKSTFYVSGKYNWETYRSASYEIFDPAGNNLSRMPNNHTWVRNFTGRLKFAINSDIALNVGGQYGVTSWENSDIGWLYANDPGVFLKTTADGRDTMVSNGVPERVAKQNVGNQFVTNYFVRINHTLSATSFYELTVSNTSNSDEGARRKSFDDPNFWSGFDLLLPQDDWALAGLTFIEGKDRIVDWYQSTSKLQPSKDGYLLEKDILQPNPFTGYIETQSNTTGTNNPWGMPNAFITHGSDGFGFRDGNFWQIDGSLTNVLQDGDFNHNIKTGFEVRFYEQRLHNNGNPTSDEPFYDVYSDLWGGNIYAENQQIYEKTSKPYHPFRAAIYAQDQITYKGIIFSPGLRLDYFDPNTLYRLPSNTFVPITADTGFANAKVKLQVSPRVNVTYPITERSFVNMSYGIFYKIPELQVLYDGFAKARLRGNDILGDPNLEVQRTNYYQVGYSNQIADDFQFDITAYYKDIYNQLGIKYVAASPDPYFQYAVAEYGNAKGIEFTLSKRPTMTDHFGFNINYTLSNVVGTSSSAGSNYNPPTDPYSGKIVYPLTTYPLGYDRTHNIVGVINFVWFDGQGPSIGGINFLENVNINFTTRFITGAPYTRFEPGGKALSEINAERQPSSWNVNMRISKSFLLRDWFGESAGNSSFEIFLDVYNLLDRFVPVGVYSTSGDQNDNGSSLNRRIGDFGDIPYYKEANFGIAETYSVNQYDSFGNRLYNEYADYDKNGVVTQAEKFQSYINYIEMALSYRGNYSFPRTANIGLMFRF